MELNEFELKLINQLRKSKIENPFLMKFYNDKHNLIEITILEKTNKLTDNELQLFLQKMPTHFAHYSKLIEDALVANKDWTYFNTYHIPNKANKWKPIEYAPKNGTELLLHYRDGVTHIGCWDETLKKWIILETIPGDPDLQPTHWFPIPIKGE